MHVVPGRRIHSRWDGDAAMLEHGLLDWAVRAVSLFDLIIALWLGVMVLLHANERRWSTWAASVGLMLGGLFFAGQATIVGRPLNAFSREWGFYWYAIWLPFLIWPYLWYAVMGWYTGLARERRHRTWLWAMGAIGVLLLALDAPLLPPYMAILTQQSLHIPALLGVPLIALLYPAFGITCEVLALRTLHERANRRGEQGDTVAGQSHVWLVGTTYSLLAVVVAVGFVAVVAMRAAAQGTLMLTDTTTLAVFIGCDIVISLLIAVVIVLLGEAIISFETFTGNALPQSNLAGQWRLIQVLAAYFSILIAGSLELSVPSIFPLVLATTMLAMIVGIVGWRASVDRERDMARLRPFVASQRLVAHVVDPTLPGPEVAAPFVALCADILGCEAAYLVPLGSLASLAGEPLRYPATLPIPPALGEWEELLRGAPTSMSCIALTGAGNSAVRWGVPLWSERGLIGALLLGPKRNGQVYTQEEIAIAQATGERLIDTQASAEITQRLLRLQRERLVTTQVVDQRVRRDLHDEILPRLHAAILLLSNHATVTMSDEGMLLLGEIHHAIADMLRVLPTTTTADVANRGVIAALHGLIAHDPTWGFAAVTWEIDPEAATLLEALPAITDEVLFSAAREIVRNAARYGRGDDERRSLSLTIAATRDAHNLCLRISDDGVGMTASTVSLSSGHGLDLHSTLLAIVGGTLTVADASGGGTAATIMLPIAAYD